MAVVLLIVLAGAAFLTRTMWEPLFHHAPASRGISVGNTSASQVSAVRCPENIAADIPGGNGSTTVASYESSEYYVILCRTTDGRIYYHGMERSNAQVHITLPAQRENGGYIAHNGAYSYQVTGHRLIVTENGTKLLDQALSPLP